MKQFPKNEQDLKTNERRRAAQHKVKNTTWE